MIAQTKGGEQSVSGDILILALIRQKCLLLIHQIAGEDI